jgi:hypothetical protein
MRHSARPNSSSGRVIAMTPEERRRMNWLCKQIQEERDPKRFGQLITELNELIAEKESRITSFPEQREA